MIKRIKNHTYEIFWWIIWLIWVIIVVSLRNTPPQLDTPQLNNTPESEIWTSLILNITGEKLWYISWFSLHQDNCDFQETGDYKYIDIATPDNRIYTKATYNPLYFTKPIQISWDVNTLWLCVMADISDKSSSYSEYKKPNSYYSMVYVYFDPNTWGYVNVAYYKPSWQYYDANSDSTHTLGTVFDWKFWSSNTPKKFLLNLDNIIVANTENDVWYSRIRPSNLFKNWHILNIWWFMNGLWKAYRASSISSYRIIYKWEWTIMTP